jgi:CheY-like chemotaxis protein
MAKILIVEDNEMNRDMLSRHLARRGYEITMAVDGEEGIAAAKTHTAGYQPYEFERFGVDIKANLEMTEEFCDILDRAFSQDFFSYNGKHYQIPKTHIPGSATSAAAFCTCTRARGASSSLSLALAVFYKYN